MGQSDLAATAKRLYEHFLAPLVLGGALTTGPAVGARAGLALEGNPAAVDSGIQSAVDLARLRVARRLLPLNVALPPSAATWALAAALHDLVHALHPSFQGVLYRVVPDRLFDFVEQLLERVPAAGSLEEAVSRHTFFARAFDLQRTDVFVRWWVGAKRFVGTDPPARLLAWPGVRRVRTDRTRVTLFELAARGGALRQERFAQALARWLAKIPLTDLANSTRSEPKFEWTGATLSFFATPHARVLALRALALGPVAAVDAALGRATRPHVEAGAWDNVARVGDVLAERALVFASGRAESEDLIGPGHDSNADALFARSLGAALALPRVAALSVPAATAREITSRLTPLAHAARGVAAQLRLAD